MQNFLLLVRDRLGGGGSRRFFCPAQKPPLCPPLQRRCLFPSGISKNTRSQRDFAFLVLFVKTKGVSQYNRNTNMASLAGVNFEITAPFSAETKAQPTSALITGFNKYNPSPQKMYFFVTPSFSLEEVSFSEPKVFLAFGGGCFALLLRLTCSGFGDWGSERFVGSP